MKARTETELIADCHGGTEVNLVTALGFYSMFGSLESLLNLEQRHEIVPGVFKLSRSTSRRIVLTDSDFILTNGITEALSRHEKLGVGGKG